MGYVWTYYMLIYIDLAD